jgi:chemotaxis-related protein WspD
MIELPPAALTVVHDCWNRIGVRGDRSCPELAGYVHCRNCPVHGSGAANLLDGEVSAGYLSEQTTLFARPVVNGTLKDRSAFIFRLGSEWLSLPTSVVAVVATVRPIRTLPHRQTDVVRGLASVRGQLLVCVALGRIIGVEPLPEEPPRRSTRFQRMLVLQRDGARVICAVDEVHGIHRFHPQELAAVPSTIAGAAVTYSTGLLPWRGQWVGVLDAELVFHTMTRSLA